MTYSRHHFGSGPVIQGFACALWPVSQMERPSEAEDESPIFQVHAGRQERNPQAVDLPEKGSAAGQRLLQCVGSPAFWENAHRFWVRVAGLSRMPQVGQNPTKSTGATRYVGGSGWKRDHPPAFCSPGEQEGGYWVGNPSPRYLEPAPFGYCEPMELTPIGFPNCGNRVGESRCGPPDPEIRSLIVVRHQDERIRARDPIQPGDPGRRVHQGYHPSRILGQGALLSAEHIPEHIQHKAWPKAA